MNDLLSVSLGWLEAALGIIVDYGDNTCDLNGAYLSDEALNLFDGLKNEDISGTVWFCVYGEF